MREWGWVSEEWGEEVMGFEGGGGKRTGLCSRFVVGSIAGSVGFVSGLWRVFAWCGRICGTFFWGRGGGGEVSWGLRGLRGRVEGEVGGGRGGGRKGGRGLRAFLEMGFGGS